MDWDDNILDSIIRDLAGNLDEATDSETPVPGFDTSSAPERQLALALKQDLLEKYKDSTAIEVFDAQEISNEYGKCLKITDKQDIRLKLTDFDLAQEKLVNDLKLVSGIKETREKRLKSEGYKTLYHLLDHPVYGQEAGRVVDMLEKQDIEQIQLLIRQRYGAWSAETAIYLSAYYKPEDFLFFDIETMGLFHRAIILFGFGYIRNGQIIVDQFLLTDYDDEPAALYEALKITRQAKALVSFNGRAFDYNYINQRLAYNFLPPLPELPHFDLLHFARKRWGFLPDTRLKTLERHLLDIERSDDLPSDMVPVFFMEYLETQNPGPLVPIVTHNRQDIVSLAKLFAELHRQINLES